MQFLARSAIALSDTTRAVKTSSSHAIVIKKKLPDIQNLFNILCYSVLSSTCADTGADLDILFRGVDLLTDSHIYTHNYSITNIVSQSYYTPGP